jgi:hypothetical protein
MWRQVPVLHLCKFAGPRYSRRESRKADCIVGVGVLYASLPWFNVTDMLKKVIPTAENARQCLAAALGGSKVHN